MAAKITSGESAVAALKVKNSRSTAGRGRSSKRVGQTALRATSREQSAWPPEAAIGILSDTLGNVHRSGRAHGKVIGVRVVNMPPDALGDPVVAVFLRGVWRCDACGALSLAPTVEACKCRNKDCAAYVRAESGGAG